MSDDKIRAIKKTVELDPEQAELLAELRNLLDRALRGEVIGLTGLVILGDEYEQEPLVTGRIWSVGETYLGLHNVADMVRVQDIEDMLGLEDDDE